jgi:signal transduction histidine kinase
MDIIHFQNSQIIQEENKRRQESQYKKDMHSDKLLSIGLIHDLANLCNIILGNIELLIGNNTPRDKNYKRLTTIKSTSLKTIETCNLFIADFTDQITTDVIFPLSDLLNETSYQKLNNSTQIFYKLNEDLWDIKANRKEIKLLVKNLLYNAEQSMPSGGDIWITAENVCVKEHLKLRMENHIKISIKDNGCGIPENIRDKIFIPNFTTKKHGTGLGLALCKHIIEKYKGRIQVESVPEKGTVVTVFLPAVNC